VAERRRSRNRPALGRSAPARLGEGREVEGEQLLRTGDAAEEEATERHETTAGLAARQREGGRGDDRSLDSPAHALEPGRLVDRRAQNREVEPLGAADVAVEHLAQVQPHEETGRRLPCRPPLRPEPIDPLERGLCGVESGPTGCVLLLVEREDREHTVAHELQDLAAELRDRVEDGTGISVEQSHEPVRGQHVGEGREPLEIAEPDRRADRLDLAPGDPPGEHVVADVSPQIGAGHRAQRIEQEDRPPGERERPHTGSEQFDLGLAEALGAVAREGHDHAGAFADNRPFRERDGAGEIIGQTVGEQGVEKGELAALVARDEAPAEFGQALAKHEAEGGAAPLRVVEIAALTAAEAGRLEPVAPGPAHGPGPDRRVEDVGAHPEAAQRDLVLAQPLGEPPDELTRIRGTDTRLGDPPGDARGPRIGPAPLLRVHRPGRASSTSMPPIWQHLPVVAEDGVATRSMPAERSPVPLEPAASTLSPTPTRPTADEPEPATIVERHPVLRHLLAAGRVDPLAAERAAAVAAERNEPLAVRLVRDGVIDGAGWAEATARVLGVERAGADDFPECSPLGETVSPRFLRHTGMAPIAHDDTHVWVAMVDPTDVQGLKAIGLATGLEPVPVAATLEDVETALARWFDRGAAALQRLVSDLDDEGHTGGDEVERLLDSAQEAPVVRLVNQLLADALHMKASDIHIEPFPDHLRVRYRVHGRLREIASPPVRYASAIVSRIKILAKLDIAERRLPQDGRARLELDGRRVDLRVATAPTVHGESVVVRLLESDRRGVGLDELGLAPEVEKRVRSILRSPHGMLLVTGPTGSGKTTTLYAALRSLDRDTLKVVSVEDPVEYQIDGVTQIHVRPDIGLDFARVLRSVVRHDPDVVMVGETRDAETAEIAVHAALTGHLLLSTLHTNSAAGAVARLLDMGVEPYLLASVLRAVIGQRLVGVLCPNCREPRPAEPDERELLNRHAPAGAILYRAPGCSRCDGLGIVGRVGIFELLEVDDRIRGLIRERASTQAIQSAAEAGGMRTMWQDGVGKALAGVTTLDEVRRVTEDW